MDKQSLKEMHSVRISAFYEGTETRALETDDNSMILEGYAALYEVPSNPMRLKNGREFNEILSRGIFEPHLNEDVILTFNHDRDKVLARTTNGTLLLKSDDRGLQFRATLNDTTDSRDLYERVKRGDISECSFQFKPDFDRMRADVAENEETPRLRIDGIARLSDVSLVTFAQYPQTVVFSRELNDEMENMLKPEEEDENLKPKDSKRYKMLTETVKIKANIKK